MEINLSVAYLIVLCVDIVMCMYMCPLKDYRPCPQRWTYVHNETEPAARACVRLEKEKKSFQDAVKSCKLFYDAWLVQILDANMQKGLEEVFRQHRYRRQDLYWIALQYSDKDDSPMWRTDNGTKLRPSYFKNDLRPKTTGSVCYAINPDTGIWSPAPCRTQLSFICTHQQFTDHPGRPTLTTDIKDDIIYLGTNISVTCRAFTGTTKVLSIHVGRLKQKSTLSYDDPRGSVTEVYRRIGGECRRHLTVGFNVAAPKLYFKVAVTCLMHEPNGPVELKHCSPLSCAKSHKFQIIDPRKRATAVAHFHGPAHRIHLGRPVLITCSACIKGPHAELDFFIEKNYKHKKRVEDTDERIYVKAEKRACGTFTTKALIMNASKALEDWEIRCEGASTRDGGHKDFLWSSKVTGFKAEIGPSKPVMFVDYHFLPTILVLGWNLTANCSACVGSGGKIYWDVIDADNRALDRESMDELKMWEDVHTELGNFLDDSSECNHRVTSNLALKVNEDLDRSQLVCRSYHGTYLDGHDVEAFSLIFHLAGSIGHYEVHRFYLLETLLLFLLFLWLVCLCALCCQPRLAYYKARQVAQPGVVTLRKIRSQVATAPRLMDHTRFFMRRVESSRNVHGTPVDSPRMKQRPARSSIELAEILKISLPEARRRMQRFREQGKVVKSRLNSTFNKMGKLSARRRPGGTRGGTGSPLRGGQQQQQQPHQAQQLSEHGGVLRQIWRSVFGGGGGRSGEAGRASFTAGGGAQEDAGSVVSASYSSETPSIEHIMFDEFHAAESPVRSPSHTSLPAGAARKSRRSSSVDSKKYPHRDSHSSNEDSV